MIFIGPQGIYLRWIGLDYIHSYPHRIKLDARPRAVCLIHLQAETNMLQPTFFPKVSRSASLFGIVFPGGPDTCTF